jgi:ribosomal protein S18 acetylase RimI-like enzyme
MHPHLAFGYSVRSPTTVDIPAILTLMHDYDLAETGQVAPLTPRHILSDWEDVNPATDAWLILAPDGHLAGYALLLDDGAGRLLADGYVHPAWQGRGIGTTIIALMEQRAALLLETQPTEARVVLVNNVMASSPAACSLMETRGYALTRVFFRMQMLLKVLPPVPAWPEGISVRTCDDSEEDIYRAYETAEEGFKDHWAHIPRSFEDWHKHMSIEQIDRSLWFLAQDGNQMVGTALCRTRADGTGWINTVAVLRPWRKRGLGLALLHQAFAAFYQRGIRQVGLGVDAQSLTGAQRLYERAGMHVQARIARYEKELRPGKDLLSER